MKNIEFDQMATDDLWDLHQRIREVLNRKFKKEKERLEGQLNELDRKFGRGPKHTPQRRPYPQIRPKYCNPTNVTETWSGRGKTPRWLALHIASGRQLAEFEIAALDSSNPSPELSDQTS